MSMAIRCATVLCCTKIQTHAIAIGDDADEVVLERIANSAYGKFWKGQTAKDIVAIYKDIAAQY